MASGDCSQRHHTTFCKSEVPLIGALIDYINTSVEYLYTKTFKHAENFYLRSAEVSTSATFMATVCLVFGLVANVKLEVVTLDRRPLPNDLHVVLLSNKYYLYVDDIDVTKILCCIEASDMLLIVISCLLIWGSSYTRSPTSEYMYLPWLGATLRGILLRQAPSCTGLIYTMFIANGRINKTFLASFALLIIAELRLWLEIVRLVCSCLPIREACKDSVVMEDEGQTLLSSNDEIPSFEVSNYIY